MVTSVPSPSGNAESAAMDDHDDDHAAPHDVEAGTEGVGSGGSDSRKDSAHSQQGTTSSDVDMIDISAPSDAGSNNMTPFDVANRRSPPNEGFDFT